MATYDMHWNNVRNHKNSACIRVRVKPQPEYAKGSKANDSILLPTINQLNSTLSALVNFSSALRSRLSSTDSTPTNHLNNNKSQGVEGGKLFVVVGGEGVVVLAGLLCVACYQTRTSARTRVDSAHLSRRRAIPSFVPPRAAAVAGRPASDRSTPLHGHGRSRDLSPCKTARLELRSAGVPRLGKRIPSARSS